MAFGFKYGTNYDYETSEDESLSFIGTISWGTIILNDRRDDSKLKINYRCASIGNGKGLPVNMSHSDFSNWSGGDAVVANRHFYDGVFPCQGYMIGAGGGIGLTDSAENSASVTLVLFGMAPVFAGVRMWGASVAALPGVGLSAGVARFWVA
ncbi:MAG: hypothetical protein IPI03_09290 [Rubrivivax sp.]|jgi:hypothetical protein|nr:hypothetical protein [Rubrivivax sp.]MBK7262036.1 hypothetical protein [Rubrivivax sp.]MBK8528246.1 hypothetical protein [Rubrivivax sp.]